MQGRRTINRYIETLSIQSALEVRIAYYAMDSVRTGESEDDDDGRYTTMFFDMLYGRSDCKCWLDSW